MSAQLPPISVTMFASALLALGLGVPANVALAVDCLTAPNSPTPPNGHWYYRTDRTQDRKCWHLQKDSGQSEQGAVQTAREAPAKRAQSVAADFYSGPGVTQHGRAKLSDEDLEEIYAAFLEWKRRTKN